MNPMLQLIEIAVFKNLLNKYKPEKVLEWGAGGSTVQFSLFPFIKTWTAIENNIRWAEKVRANVDNKKVHVWNFEDLGEYVSRGALLERDPDFVIVDGRERVACLKEVHKIVRPGIPVLLHDYRRSRYKEGMDRFEHQEILVESLSSDKPNTIDKDVSSDGLYWHQGIVLLKKEQ